MWPRTLRGLGFLFFILVLTATVVTGVTTIFVIRSTITDLVDQRIARESESIVGDAHAGNLPVLVARIGQASRRRESADIGFELIDARGHRIAGNVRMRRALPNGYSTLDAGDGIDGLTHGRALKRDLGSGLALITLAETEPIEHYHGWRIAIHIAGFGSIILIVVAGLIFFSVIISRRIADTRRTVEAIIDGDMKSRVPVDGSGSEFDQQAAAFNRMLDRISALMASMASVSNDIAHDLRTPLSRLRAQLARLARAGGTDAETRKELETALAQGDALLEILTAILRIAEVEGGNRRAGFAMLDIAELVREIVAAMEPVAQAEGQSLTMGAPPPLVVRGDRQLLSQALLNLIENALRYTPAGTAIRVAIERQDRLALLVVQDDGPGISANDRKTALRRFGRLDAARNREGHGLGLPLVEAITRLHRGTLTLADAEPGLRVTITLPIAP